MDSTFLRGICIKWENFVYLKDPSGSSLPKKVMMEVSWAILEFIRLLLY